MVTSRQLRARRIEGGSKKDRRRIEVGSKKFRRRKFFRPVKPYRRVHMTVKNIPPHTSLQFLPPFAGVKAQELDDRNGELLEENWESPAQVRFKIRIGAKRTLLFQLLQLFQGSWPTGLRKEDAWSQSQVKQVSKYIHIAWIPDECIQLIPTLSFIPYTTLSPFFAGATTQGFRESEGYFQQVSV